MFFSFFFFFNDTATTEIYTLSLHDALPISFVTPRQIDFLFDCLPQPFAIGNKSLHVNVFPRKHGQVPFDGRTNFSPRIPVPAEGESESLGNIFDPIVNSSHTTRDLLQAPLLVTAPGQREA